MILAINAIVTTNHGMGQQFGLTSAIARYKGAYFTWWKSLGLIINNLVYFLFYFSIKIKPNILQDLLILTAGLMAIFLILTVYMNKQITRREGTTYSWYAFSLIFFAFLMVFSGYKFFAMLVTRVIHDLTAFYFYNTHNVNKWYDNKNSKIHAWLVSGKFIKYAIVFLITPLMAIIVARGISLFASFTILNCISLFHYWTESFTWKNGTPHRKFIPMA
ncbi:hypothetical protein H7Y21_00080 [Arenimonas sp.]|nr:hypothetical protein [Candidatus Parcubacteria bacterium]